MVVQDETEADRIHGRGKEAARRGPPMVGVSAPREGVFRWTGGTWEIVRARSLRAGRCCLLRGIIGTTAGPSLFFVIRGQSRQFGDGSRWQRPAKSGPAPAMQAWPTLRESGAQVGGGGFGGVGVDEATGAPLEAGDLRQPRSDLDMPVIVVVCGHVKGLRVEKVVIGDWADRTFDTTDHVTRKPRKLAKLAKLRIFKSRLMLPGRNPDFVWKSTGIRTKGDEPSGLSDDAGSRGDLAIDHVEQERTLMLR